MTITYKIIDQNTQDFTYLDDICDLMERINKVNGAPYLCPPDRDFFKKALDDKHLAVLAFDNTKLVGYKIIKFLAKWPGYMGPVKGYDASNSVMFLFIIVDPEYRGQKIGSAMNEIGLKEVQNSTRTHAFTTVHPDNIANIKNAEKLGFVELEQREMFDEKLLRSLMYMKI